MTITLNVICRCADLCSTPSEMHELHNCGKKIVHLNPKLPSQDTAMAGTQSSSRWVPEWLYWVGLNSPLLFLFIFHILFVCFCLHRDYQKLPVLTILQVIAVGYWEKFPVSNNCAQINLIGCDTATAQSFNSQLLKISLWIILFLF